MIVEKTTLSYINSLNIFVYMGAFALKSANRIFVMDMVGTFFAFKRIIPKCRSPPTIKLDFKKFELIGGINMATMPKRRKDKDNPYTLDYNDNEHIYTVSFMDSKNKIHNVEVSKKVFEAFDRFELEDISQLHKMDKHIDGRNIDNNDSTDIVLYHLGVTTYKSVEEEVEDKLQNEELYKAINLLSKTQKRRIKMYYFDNLSLEQISKIEKCSFQAISKSILTGITNLKNKLKN